MSVPWQLVEPALVRLGLYAVPDPTYGRYTLPHHPPHLDLINHPQVKRRYRRVFLRPFSDFSNLQEGYETSEVVYSEDVSLEPAEVSSGVARGGRWVFYSTWELRGAESEKGAGRDLVLTHGLSDYGLRYSPHVLHHLKAGFRVIIPDLPSYGRSTGIHSYLPSLALLPAALHAVLADVVADDLLKGRKQRQVFLSGASMGGWTVLYYILKYPPSSSPVVVAEGSPRVQVAGAFVMCPMVEVSSQSRPYYLTELAGRAIKYVAGTLPLAKALRGKVSDDPRVEEDFFSDPLCYRGWLRVATGLSLLQGMTDLLDHVEDINVPIRLIHGNKDRVTSHSGTQRLFDRLPHSDKQFEVYDGYEHVMMRVGRDEADDAQRQRVLRDWQEWLLARCA